MDYKVIYTSKAQKDLYKLSGDIAKRILTKVSDYVKLDNPLDKAKKLKGFDEPTFRFRVGDFRIVFRLDKKTKKLVILVVLRIQHRKDIYKDH